MDTPADDQPSFATSSAPSLASERREEPALKWAEPSRNHPDHPGSGRLSHRAAGLKEARAQNGVSLKRLPKFSYQRPGGGAPPGRPR